MYFPADDTDDNHAAITQAWFQAFIAGTIDDLPQPQPGFGPFHYRCTRCDVVGHGEACWCCGTTDDLAGQHPLHMTNASRGPDFGAA